MDLTDVLAFSFSSSFKGRGQLESRIGAEVSSLSKSITGSEMGVGWGILVVVTRVGEVAVRSGNWVSMAVSSGGIGEEMDE